MLTIQQWISVLTLFISFCVAVTIYSLGKNQSFNQAPGYSKRAITKPRFWSFAGVKDLLRVFRSVKNGTVLSYLDSLWSRYGDTYVISFFGTRIIFTRDAVNIKHILAFQWLDYDATKGIRTEMFKDVAPGTIASVDGKHGRTNDENGVALSPTIINFSICRSSKKASDSSYIIFQQEIWWICNH